MPRGTRNALGSSLLPSVEGRDASWDTTAVPQPPAAHRATVSMKRSNAYHAHRRRAKLGCEQLESRRVLDASALLLFDQTPELSGQALTLDRGGTATANAQFGDWTYTSSGSAVTITGYTGAGGAVEIPAQISQTPVRFIGDYAFFNRTDLTSVTITTGVMGIGSYAFYGCKGLTSVVVPAGVTSIGSRAFAYCGGVKSITIPPSVLGIGDAAFVSCVGLESVNIPSGVTSIGGSAFLNCTRLTSISIPGSVASIGTSAFSNCWSLTVISVDKANLAYADHDGMLCNKALTSLIMCPPGKTGTARIPSSVTSIDSGAFVTCPSLDAITVDLANTVYASVDGVLYSKSMTSLMQCPGAREGTFVIPTGVTTIGVSAFNGCNKLVQIDIPETVTSVLDYAFRSCLGLTSVMIPASVASIQPSAFGNCTSLASIAVAATSAAYAGVGGILYNKSATTLLVCPAGKTGTISIPASVQTINSSAFLSCAAVARISIPASVTSVGGGAFSDCTGLSAITVDGGNAAYADVDGVLYSKSLSSLIQCPAGKTGSVVIASGVTSIGNIAFNKCSGLTRITLPSSLLSIGVNAFYACSGLTSILIPASVTSIQAYAFTACTGLDGIYCLGDSPDVANTAVYGTPAVVYRLSNATGWSSWLWGRPVNVFQPVSVPAGQKITASIAAETSRVLKQGAGTAILSTPSTRTGGTVVEAGEIAVSHKNALGTGLLEVQAGAKATFQTGYDTVAITSLALANTARLEVGTSKLTVAANGFTESDIRAKLIAGRNGGSWDGAAGITSNFAGGDRSIGYRVADGALEVAYAAPGDSNLDGVIDILDLSEILSAGRFNTGDSANWSQGDTNYDGVFDILDISEILGTGLFNQGNYLPQGSATSTVADDGPGVLFNPALVFAGFATEQDATITKKRIRA